MAISIEALVRIGTARGRTTWMYRSTTDLIAAIQGSGYFNAASGILMVGDWILCEGDDGAAALYVATNSAGIVTTAAATDGAAVTLALINIAGGILLDVSAADVEASRDLVPYHSIAAGAPRVTYADRIAPKLRATLRSGRYYGGDFANPGIATTFAVTANVHYALPFILHRRTTFNAIAASVTTLHASNLRMGIYAHENGLPGARILDAGEVSAGSTGVKDIAVSQTLSAGIYWLTSVYAGTPTMRAAGFHTGIASTPDLVAILGTGTVGTQDSRVTASLTYGALPATFGSVTYAAGESPGHYLKAA